MNSIEGSTSILAEAHRLTHGERNEDYGDPHPNMKATADMVNAYLRSCGLLREGAEIAPHQMAMIQILVKVAREAHKPKRDTYVDIAGYADVAHRCVQTEVGEYDQNELPESIPTLNGGTLFRAEKRIRHCCGNCGANYLLEFDKETSVSIVRTDKP